MFLSPGDVAPRARRGILHALTPQKRGPKTKRSALDEENQKLRRYNERLSEDLRKAEIVIEKKKWLLYCGVRSALRTAATVMAAVGELSALVGIQAACEVVGLPRSNFYRRQRPTFGPCAQPDGAGKCARLSA